MLTDRPRPAALPDYTDAPPEVYITCRNHVRVPDVVLPERLVRPDSVLTNCPRPAALPDYTDAPPAVWLFLFLFYIGVGVHAEAAPSCAARLRRRATRGVGDAPLHVQLPSLRRRLACGECEQGLVPPIGPATSTAPVAGSCRVRKLDFQPSSACPPGGNWSQTIR